MKTRTYQIALASAVAVCISLAAALAYVASAPRPLNVRPQPRRIRLLRAGRRRPRSPRRRATHRRPGAEPALAPVQLSPQRLQEIGVTTAVAELKNVSDDLNVPGNVDIDEEKLVLCADPLSGLDSGCLRERDLPVRAQRPAPLHRLQP